MDDPYFTTNPARYENVSLPSDISGEIENYQEHIYESSIKTSAGDVHFSPLGIPDYFAHTRVEDIADGTTRRVIEVQSDLFQKGRLENEHYAGKSLEDARSFVRGNVEMEAQQVAREAELAKLEPYRDTWYERIIGEEIKRAAEDGKTKLQFPTGETAMKIEGLGESAGWAIFEDGRHVLTLQP